LTSKLDIIFVEKLTNYEQKNTFWGVCRFTIFKDLSTVCCASPPRYIVCCASPPRYIVCCASPPRYIVCCASLPRYNRNFL